jgi:putative heme transporter
VAEELSDPPRRLVAVARGRAVRFVGVLLAAALLSVEGVLLAPHFSGIGAALARVRWPLLLLAVVAELCSFAAFAAMYRQMLRAGLLRIGFWRVAALVVAANALSATLPAGSALATGYSFHRIRRLGASIPLAAWVVVVTGVVSGATLTLLGLAGALFVGSRGAGWRATLPTAGGVLAVGLVVLLAARRPQLLITLGTWMQQLVSRLLRRKTDADAQRVQRFVNQLAVIRPRRIDWLAAVGYAALNWGGDVACLILACKAVGVSDLSARTMLVTYAADAGAGLLQLLPGGLGTVDGAIVLALVNGGVPVSLATAGVLVYRLITFVFMAAVGWVVWLLLRTGPVKDGGPIA